MALWKGKPVEIVKILKFGKILVKMVKILPMVRDGVEYWIIGMKGFLREAKLSQSYCHRRNMPFSDICPNS